MIWKNICDGTVTESRSGVDLVLGGCKRIKKPLQDSYSETVDIHENEGVQFHFIKIHAGDGYQELDLLDDAEISQCHQVSEMGTLLRLVKHGQSFTLWIPPVGIQNLHFDKHKRIDKSKIYPLGKQVEVYPYLKVKVKRPEAEGDIGAFSYVLWEDPNGLFFQELSGFRDIERRHYIKSEWFSVRNPGDVWNYMIDGSVYDPRADRKIGKRFKCQQCAFALWSYFGLLSFETGKTAYDIVQNEIAFSVLMDMGPNGEWGHGFWSDNIETHARFHLDGVHLLISQYEKTQEPLWLEAAERGISFLIANLSEQLEDGSFWFLHDTIEHQDKRCHFKSSLFGKSLGNSFCINTHVQALTVLSRLRRYPSNKHNYREMYEKGAKALQKVLAHQPGDWVFRILLPRIVRNITWLDRRSNVKRMVRGMEIRVLIELYWKCRQLYPRIVQPGGFTERDLTLAFFSHSYHVSNMKDFLTLYCQEQVPWLREYIENGTKFAWDFAKQMGIKNALKSGVHYVELIDVLSLFNKLVWPKFEDQVNFLEKEILKEKGGYSLDWCMLKSTQPRKTFPFA